MNLIEPIHEHARARPDALAIITPQHNISWSELDSLIWATARKISTSGLKAGDRVGVAMVSPIIHLLAALALARLGISHIAIPLSESSYYIDNVRVQLKLSKIICDSLDMSAKIFDSVLIDSVRNQNISSEEKISLSSVNSSVPWVIFQSSGTTGTPKFAILSHEDAIQINERSRGFGLEKTDIFWAASGLNFISSKRRIFEALTKGAALILTNPGPISETTINLLKKFNVSSGSGTPSHLLQIINIGKQIPSLRAFEVSYATVSEGLRQRFKSIINKNLYVVYGANEAGLLCVADPFIQEKIKNTVGLPVDSIQLEIVDELGVSLPRGRCGEVRVRGSGVITMYLDNPEATEKSFKDGWFYPGDLGYLTEEGALVLQGRKDDMMIFDGMNIYPAEIENVLSSHPAINDVAAFALKHERFQDVPVAAVTLKESVDEKDLIEFCKTLLGVKHPKRVFILKQFPRNQIGKILKRELPSLVAKMNS